MVLDVHHHKCVYSGERLEDVLEAKNEDSALLKLSEELEGYPGIKRINNGEFEII